MFFFWVIFPFMVFFFPLCPSIFANFSVTNINVLHNQKEKSKQDVDNRTLDCQVIFS